MFPQKWIKKLKNFSQKNKQNDMGRLVTVMRADDWIVDYLIQNGVTDAFGIPGVVVMDFLYALDRRKNEILPHLSYHEQAAAFAACGYAQTKGRLGVAYSTRGPGFTNMITAIADAYYDSIPVMFITAHSSIKLEPKMRILNNQEIDTVSLVKNITKKAVRIDDIHNLQEEVISAYKEATQGRKGPVFLDIYSGLFSQNIKVELEFAIENTASKIYENDIVYRFIDDLKTKIKRAKRPVILIGNGVRSEDNKHLLIALAEKYKIPILSSRSGQDLVPESKEYFGFIGSRAPRYSNFILSKADLIISLGNRMAFPIRSKSFWPIVENNFTVRVDIDSTEFNREIPNATNYPIDATAVLPAMLETNLDYEGSSEWLKICHLLKGILDRWDAEPVINTIMDIIRLTDLQMPLVCDVGNHSFWVSTAYVYGKFSNRILYSGSFGTLGSALPKAIGAYYATHKPVVCFAGDQGIQFNIQELQFIAANMIPITIVILNNSSSGMIMEREHAQYGNYLVHTTTDSGYSYPNFEKLAECYGIAYLKVDVSIDKKVNIESISNKPIIIELIIDSAEELKPKLPAGKPCQDLSPEVPRDLYQTLDKL